MTEPGRATQKRLTQQSRRARMPRSNQLQAFGVTTATKSHGRRSQIARKAETLFINADAMIKRVGLDKCGFFTRTFKDNVTSRKLAEAMNHSWNSGYGRTVFLESISVPERQERGAFHYHDLVALDCDIRT